MELLAFLTALSLHLCTALAGMDSCYEQESGKAQRCMPEFCNAAFNRTVLASDACGFPGPEEYCLQTGVTGVTKSCQVCDAQDPQRSHNASYLNDFHNEQEPTWWQSPSMLHGVQFPNSVNLTLHLGKSFEITYIRLKFHTSRPESFAIYKRTREDAPWIPYQYYSASCRQTYGTSGRNFLRLGDEERVAFCTEEFSDISPLTGGNVAFSTLEGRPSAYSFDTSPMLQEWVTATDLLISLNRLNTFGDDLFKDPQVLRSYYYAISDLSVGGRCKCNGHASECITNDQGRLVCNCQHNTVGVDCDKCRPFFHDRPWARGSSQGANQCLPCNCSGRSEQCTFSADLYRRTGHGGLCLNCRDHTAGQHCEKCEENFYRKHDAEPCQPCNCSLMGSLSLQCDQNGDCTCKASVMGKKCDQCQLGYHSLSEGGCRQCACRPEGSVGDCHPINGDCTCKQNVEGALCHSCKSGTFNLQPHNPHGCINCFCYGHSAACTSALEFSEHRVVSTFSQDADEWKVQKSGGRESRLVWEKNRISLFPENGKWEYFIAPEKFQGNQLLSYGQNLTFILDLESEEMQSFSLILEGSGSHTSVSISPHVQKEGFARRWEVTFILHEAEDSIHTPTLSSFQFQQMLSNLTAVKFGCSGAASFHLRDVTLVTAQAGLLPRAAWVEECVCPEGYIGQFCESCAPDYKREIPFGGPIIPCVPCTCNHHGTCDPESGICQCLHNTNGSSCEQCAKGYYGNPFRGRYNDCKPCPCPDQSNCAMIEETKEVVCISCPKGQTGNRCEICDDGFFGDPLGQNQFVRPCRLCYCNGNADLNAVGNCDHLTGECLKCLFHTVGHYCDRCEDGFYGNALDPNPSNKCQPCNCNPVGSAHELQTCNAVSGQCECLPNVTGRDCSRCELGYYNLQPGVGCLRCGCHPVGSRNSFCQPETGQCSCRPGVEGRLCDKCRRGYFDLSEKGCRACDCSPLGSSAMQCRDNGSCVCKKGFTGWKCEQCQENYFISPSSFHCQQCPVCYGLVTRLQQRMNKLQEELDKFSSHPEQFYQLYTNHLQLALKDMEIQSEAAIKVFGQFDKVCRSSSCSKWERWRFSLHTIGLKLTNISRALDCERNEDKHCHLVSDSQLLISTSRRELQAAKEALDNMQVPMLIRGFPGDESQNWTRVVQESRTLAESHVREAAEVESIVRQVLAASNQSYLILSGIIEDNSTAGDVAEAEDRLQVFQSKRDELEAEVDEVLKEAKRQYSYTQKARGSRPIQLLNLTELKLENWDNLTTEIEDLESTLWSKDQQIKELFVELEPRMKVLTKGLETKQSYEQLLSHVKSVRATANASLHQALQIKETGTSLLKTLEDNKRTFSVRKLKSKGVFRKMGLRERMIAEAKKKTAQARRMLGTAQSSSTVSNATAVQTSHVIRGIAKEAQKIRRQSRDQALQSASLHSQLEATREQIDAQEDLVAARKAIVQENTETAAEVLGETEVLSKSMKQAKHSLDRDVKQLTELLRKIDILQIGRITEETLNKTQNQIGALRFTINQKLTRKVRELEAASEMQILKMKVFEKDIAEIQADKHNLEDIVQNLPQGCYDKAGLRRQ
ncbi:LOW QUALITY PROTEIN: laminin subunit gamma-3-like [Pristis pectinata]|uniref:LOW QUALITY PROTEIN: laminin subunit gamma-3-like n=1 Tax=Pristis pectinata TaxID=685728 RepID=UPI00223D2845|nr:LOW QUALITY PROTEIN: laminin subunit gamma-3-like [Pristis pectinata]